MAKEEKHGKPQSQGKRAYVAQSDFPRFTLAKALIIAEELWNNFAGKGAAPHDVAMALDKSPTSGTWRNLCGASIAYGLTKGGHHAREIAPTEPGLRIVAPQSEGDDAKAKAEALLRPRVIKEFLEKYDRAKFPKEKIAENVLVGLGLPKDRVESAVEVLRENGTFTGILKETKTGLFVALDSPVSPPSDEDTSLLQEDSNDLVAEKLSNEEIASRLSGQIEKPAPIKKTNRVFISHGKNKKIVSQLKELLTFGKFEPVVSVEKEATSIPVPDKVFVDMRSCSAAVIHVSQEGELIDSEGNKHVKLNENVLIEIGAAIALYGKSFILLVQKGVKLPSNLQGL